MTQIKMTVRLSILIDILSKIGWALLGFLVGCFPILVAKIIVLLIYFIMNGVTLISVLTLCFSAIPLISLLLKFKTVCYEIIEDQSFWQSAPGSSEAYSLLRREINDFDHNIAFVWLKCKGVVIGEPHRYFAGPNARSYLEKNYWR